jgi:galactokinase/mevalonate kinase-like predicted kinase
VTEFYGIQVGTIPGFADAGGGKFMSVQGLPDRTVKNMVKFMDRLRGMHAQDALAFEVCVRHVASIIEDQRREEGHADPRDDRAP